MKKIIMMVERSKDYFDAYSDNCEGIYAAGDCIVKDLRQVVTACNDGAIAASSISRYLSTPPAHSATCSNFIYSIILTLIKERFRKTIMEKPIMSFYYHMF